MFTGNSSGKYWADIPVLPVFFEMLAINGCAVAGVFPCGTTITLNIGAILNEWNDTCMFYNRYMLEECLE